jgi:hypothetical protein
MIGGVCHGGSGHAGVESAKFECAVKVVVAAADPNGIDVNVSCRSRPVVRSYCIPGAHESSEWLLQSAWVAVIPFWGDKHFLSLHRHEHESSKKEREEEIHGISSMQPL